MMKIKALLLLIMLSFCQASFALDETEAEDLADLSAIYFFLKKDCGYNQLPNSQIKRALIFFAQQNRWDLSNYNSYNMKALGEESYRELNNIALPLSTKCQSLARDSLSLLAYAN